MKKWEYTWFHAPTDSKGIRMTDVEMTKVKFLESLNAWNRCGNGHWIYWSQDRGIDE